MSDIMEPIDDYDETDEGKLVRSLMVGAIKSLLGNNRGIFVTGRDGIQYMVISEGDEIKVHTIDEDNDPHPDGTTFTYDFIEGEVH